MDPKNEIYRFHKPLWFSTLGRKLIFLSVPTDEGRNILPWACNQFAVLRAVGLTDRSPRGGYVKKVRVEIFNFSFQRMPEDIIKVGIT
jgi:hypothetical protein